MYISEYKRLLKNKYLLKKPENGGKPPKDNRVTNKVTPK